MARDVRISAFVATAEHFPHVVEPFVFSNFGRGGPPKFAIRAPAFDFQECRSTDRLDGLGSMANVSSAHPPTIIPGEGGSLAFEYWNELVRDANLWKYPVDFLLRNRPIEIAAELWESDHRYSGRGRTIRAQLLAVKIGGELSKDEGLKAHIQERKAWFSGR